MFDLRVPLPAELLITLDFSLLDLLLALLDLLLNHLTHLPQLLYIRIMYHHLESFSVAPLRGPCYVVSILAYNHADLTFVQLRGVHPPYLREIELRNLALGQLSLGHFELCLI